MSRIGKMPIEVPSGVEVRVEGTLATVTGPRGTLSQTIPTQISVRQEGDRILAEVHAAQQKRIDRAADREKAQRAKARGKTKTVRPVKAVKAVKKVKVKKAAKAKKR